MDKHFHVYCGGTSGAMFVESNYEESDKSIEDFLGLSSGLFHNTIKSDPAVTETALHYTAANEINQAIYIDGGPLRVVWMVCDGSHCFSATRN